MKAHTKTRSRTFTVNGRKFTIKSRLRTRSANPVGYRVNINGATYDLFTLDRDEAEGSALARYLDR